MAKQGWIRMFVHELVASWGEEDIFSCVKSKVLVKQGQSTGIGR